MAQFDVELYFKLSNKNNWSCYFYIVPKLYLYPV